jgi:putative SOS response-associated peptidase YedK
MAKKRKAKTTKGKIEAGMCGRFTNRLTWSEIVRFYRLAVPAIPERNLPARYNICPTDTIDVVIGRNGERELVPMRWGLVPSWWRRPLREFKVATFNARVETVEDKAAFLLRSGVRAV